jgi:hypothetical protein
MRFSYVVAAFGVVQLLVFAFLASHIPLIGDEIWYFETSKLIAPLVLDLVGSDFHGAREILDTIVGRGWFMPGMSILVFPVTFFTDSVAMIRLYLGALNFAAVVTILVYLRKEYGDRGPRIYLLCCLAVPYYLVYCFTLWGDLVAAHLLLCLSLLVFDRRNDSSPPGLALGLTVGVALGMITMVRGFYWMFAPLFAVLFALGTPAREPLSVRLRLAAVPSGALLLALAIVMAPWTALITLRDGFHLTTTSTTLSRIVLIGSNEYFNGLRQYPCGPDGSLHRRDITSLDNYIRCVAYRERRTYAEQSRVELALVTAGVPYADMVRAVAANVRSFVFDSEEILDVFAQSSSSSTGQPPREWRQALFEMLMKLNHWGWRVLLTIGILLFLTPMAPTPGNLLLSTIYKYSAALYSVHPFMVDAHGRYYVEYIPLIAATAAAFARTPQPLLALKLPSDSLQWLVLVGQVIALLVAPALAIAYFAAV